MKNKIQKTTAVLFTVLFLSVSAASAQVAQPDNNVEQAAGQLTSTVTASATAERVRFTSPNTVVQLQPVRYEYKPDNALGLRSSGEHIGFGAQAVQKIIPEAVTSNDRGYLLVNNDPILWTMLNAIKEQQKQILELKREIVSFKARIGKHHRRANVQLFNGRMFPRKKGMNHDLRDIQWSLTAIPA